MTVRPAPLCAVLVCLAVLSAAVSFAQPAPAPAAPTLLPPHVVACTPAAFAANVDVNTAQISITFDRPMNTGGADGFGSLRWFAVYPGAKGKKALPTWNADGTVGSLPVKLEADTTYAVTVNAAAEAKPRAGGKAAGVFTDPTGAPALPFTWAFSTGARTPGDFPASVVSSVPAQATADVDATTQQITVTFNRPVAPAELKLTPVAACGALPEAAPVKGHGHGRKATEPTGPISLSADRLTATIQVSLVPGTVYALSLNSASQTGWQDTNGRPVLPYAWCFKTAGTAPAPPAPTAGGPAPGATTAPAPAK